MPHHGGSEAGTEPATPSPDEVLSPRERRRPTHASAATGLRRYVPLLDSLPRLATAILDFEAVPEVDSTGDAALSDLRRTLKIAVWTPPGRSYGSVRGDLRTDGVVQALGPDCVFAMVRDAVASLDS